MLKRFAKFIKATVADDVSETTTHLVVESDKHFICGVTSKYLKAISRKIWIVSIMWILQSVNHNKLLDPVGLIRKIKSFMFQIDVIFNYQKTVQDCI